MCFLLFIIRFRIPLQVLTNLAVKVKLSLCLIKLPTWKAYRGMEVCIVPLILILDAKWRLVVIFRRPILPPGKKKLPVPVRQAADWVPRAGLGAVEKRSN
jgi:hypothetical protein